MLALPIELTQSCRQIRDGVEEQVGVGGAQARFGGERAEHRDGADSRAAGHFEIFRGITYVNGGGGIQTHLTQGQSQRSGMRLAVTCVSAANARREKIGEPEEAQLALDAIAVAAGYHAEFVARAKMRQHAADTRHQLWAMRGVLLAPGAVGVTPTSARQFRGA